MIVKESFHQGNYRYNRHHDVTTDREILAMFGVDSSYSRVAMRELKDTGRCAFGWAEWEVQNA